MIFDTISNANQYLGIHPGINSVLHAFSSFSSDHFPTERVFLNGKDVYMVFAEYDTHDRNQGLMEAHRAYIDVMYMIDGSETVYTKPVNCLQRVFQEYNSDTDALLADIDEDVSAIRLEAGSILILFPEDAHAPACHTDGTNHVKKIIGKVRIT